MSRKLTSLACALLLTGTVALLSRAAHAEQSIQVEVTCPGLSNEESSAVEARAYAELLARHIEVGTLELSCGQISISAVFTVPHSSAHALVERTVTSPAERVDALVSLVSKLLDEEAKAAAERARLEQSPAPPPSPAPATASEDEPTNSPPAVEPKNTPPKVPKVETEPPAPRAADTEPSAPKTLPASSLLVGAAFEPWSSEIAGTAGFLVGVTAPLAPHCSARASANLAWGLSSTHQVSVRQLLLEGAVEATLTRWSILSLGGGLSSMSFDGGDLEPDGPTTSLSGVLTGAVRLAPAPGSPRFTVGPVARWFGKVRDAEVDDEVVLHTPRWSLTLEVEGRLDL